MSLTEYDILKEQNEKLFDENRKVEAKIHDLNSKDSVKIDFSKIECTSLKYEKSFEKKIK